MKNATFLLIFGLVLTGAARVSAQTSSTNPDLEIVEMRFEGNRLFAESLLTEKMKQCLGPSQKKPSSFRSAVFEYCLHTLANYERSQGYLQAKFGEPRVQQVGQVLIVTTESDEGVRYRVGNLVIEGAYHVPTEEIHEMLGMRRGEIANGDKLAKTFYEDLKSVYGDKGFIQYTAEIEPTFRSGPGAAEGIVDLKIIVDEGKQFRLRTISFTGKNLPEVFVKRLLRMREGDVYSQKLLEESIQRINETGLFNRVDKDRDVDYRTNEEEKVVDVIVKLSRLDMYVSGH